MSKQLPIARVFLKDQRESKKKVEDRLKQSPVVPIYHKVELKAMSGRGSGMEAWK